MQKISKVLVSKAKERDHGCNAMAFGALLGIVIGGFLWGPLMEVMLPAAPEQIAWDSPALPNSRYSIAKSRRFSRDLVLKSLGQNKSDVSAKDQTTTLGLGQKEPPQSLDQAVDVGEDRYSADNISQYRYNEADLEQLLATGSCKDCELSGVDLSGKDLRKAQLQGSNLRGANLLNANLTMAELSGANLSRASLSLAILHQATIFEANLKGADLSGATLTMADLSGANLKNARLENANLKEAHLETVVLEGANLTSADLSLADLSGTDMTNAILSDTILEGARGMEPPLNSGI